MRARCEYSHSSVRTVKYGARIVQLSASKVVESTVRSNTLDVTRCEGARMVYLGASTVLHGASLVL